METIYSDKIIADEIISDSFASLFPELKLFKWDFIAQEPEGYDENNSNHIIFNTSYIEDKIEFGFSINFFRTPLENSEERSLVIAKRFAKNLDCRILVSFTLPSNPQDPFYHLIIKNEDIYLADDSDTTFADGTDWKVKILKKIELSKNEFDSKGHLVKKEYLLPTKPKAH